MARHQLRFGASAVAYFGEAGPPQIVEYRVDENSRYAVRAASKADPQRSGEIIGEATVGGEPNDRWVEFETTDRNPRFYSSWVVDAATSCQVV